jgi:hypothetical protein
MMKKTKQFISSAMEKFKFITTAKLLANSKEEAISESSPSFLESQEQPA